MDDLARQVDALVGKLPSRLVGVVHGAIDAVAKAEFLGELEVKSARDGLVTKGLQPLDDRALIGTRQNRSDLGFQAETLLEIRFTHVPLSIAQLKWHKVSLQIAAISRLMISSYFKPP